MAEQMTLLVSHNELQSAATKAAAGGGVDPALAVLVGRAMVWLGCSKLDGVDELVALSDNQLVGEVCAIATMLDKLTTSDPQTAVSFESTAPLLAAGLCGVWAQQHGCSFVLSTAAESAKLDGAGLTGSLPPAGPMQVASAPTSAVHRPAGPPPGAIDVDLSVWQELTALAARRYVPSSDLSRASGAGAGLTDND